MQGCSLKEGSSLNQLPPSLPAVRQAPSSEKPPQPFKTVEDFCLACHQNIIGKRQPLLKWEKCHKLGDIKQHRFILTLELKCPQGQAPSRDSSGGSFLLPEVLSAQVSLACDTSLHFLPRLLNGPLRPLCPSSVCLEKEPLSLDLDTAGMISSHSPRFISPADHPGVGGYGGMEDVDTSFWEPPISPGPPMEPGSDMKVC